MKKVFVTGGSGFVGQNLILLLISKGYTVNALARSDKSISTIEKLGATAIKGDLDSQKAIAEGMKGCETVFHLAASVDFFASEKELYKIHVSATQLLLAEAKKANIKKFVYLSAASVIMNGKAINNVDESFVSDNIIDGYSRAKLQAEKSVLAENSSNFKTISIRPTLIWGKGDPNVLPAIIDAVKKGNMQFIGGGNHKFVTSHVNNVCQALIVADQSDKNGEAFFITDGEELVFKEFITAYVATQGVTVPDKSVSIGVAKTIATIMEFAWKTFKLKGHPPLYRALINTLGREFIISDKKARTELGYKTFVTVKQGLSEMKTK